MFTLVTLRPDELALSTLPDRCDFVPLANFRQDRQGARDQRRFQPAIALALLVGILQWQTMLAPTAMRSSQQEL